VAKDPKAKTKAPVAATRAVTVPAPEDLEHAKDDALLQLRIGRYTHFYTVVISAGLALDGFLLLYLNPSLGSLAPGAWGTSYSLLLPIGAGVMIAAVGLASKWEEFNLWPWEAHFSASVGALALNAIILFVFVAHIAGYGSFGTTGIWPWYYPLALTGISVALVALVLTWSGWSTRQWTSAIAAVLPVATALLVVFPALRPSGSTGLDAALAISLFISAILYQTSGSFLHLISSGTRSHERELITTGQTQMFRLADDVRAKEEALHFREAALIKREADAENDEMSIQRQNESLTEARTQIEALEQDYRTRSDAVVQKEREWAGKIADFESRERVIADKTQSTELREQEVARSLPLVSAREQRLVEREGELTKREVELTQRQQDLDGRTAAIPETEARLEARRKELDQKTNDLLRREGAVSAAESTAPGGAKPAAGAQDLAAREVKLQQLKLVLDELNVSLGRKAKENTERAKVVEAALKASAEKEAALATREATVRQQEADLGDRAKTVDERRGAYDTAARDYETKLAELGKTQVDTAQKAAQLDQTLKTIADREAAVLEREKRSRASLSEVESRENAVNARERALSANEAEVSLRRQEIARGSDLGIAGLAAIAAADQLDSGAGSRRTRGRDTGVRDLAESEPAGGPVAETLKAPTQRRIADRLPTGTGRLDDLLLGGLPPKSHVVLVGDAFVGKEIVLYGFIAEGLKRGEPAIIVTASRTPSEVAQSLGVVLPQFHEYEQMGMVTWIDASGPAVQAGGPHRLATKGSDDRAGILSNLVKAAKAAEGEKQAPFRTGFLGLAGVLAHGEERASFSFLQNVVGILKARNALTMYSLEGAALSDAQVETLLSRMDGAIVFRQDRDKTFLSVKGLGEVQTRDWVECRATNRALIVGSFALERIR
jgi:KaiC/GvpD/RAD55 family RecA-like ATPase